MPKAGGSLKGGGVAHPHHRSGEEVCISYGPWPNDVFFMLFGFVPADNPHDSVVLWPSMPELVQYMMDAHGVHGEPRGVGAGPCVPSTAL